MSWFDPFGFIVSLPLHSLSQEFRGGQPPSRALKYPAGKTVLRTDNTFVRPKDAFFPGGDFNPRRAGTRTCPPLNFTKEGVGGKVPPGEVTEFSYMLSVMSRPRSRQCSFSRRQHGHSQPGPSSSSGVSRATASCAAIASSHPIV